MGWNFRSSDQSKSLKEMVHVIQERLVTMFLRREPGRLDHRDGILFSEKYAFTCYLEYLLCSYIHFKKQ